MKIVGAILVGGQSQRMGRAKALLPIEGVCLVDRVEKKLRELIPTISKVVLSGKIAGRETIPDEEPQRGPVGAIHTLAKRFLGLAQGLLVVPVDLPLLEACAISPLTSHFLQTQSSAVFFCEHPLPALFRIDSDLIEKSLRADSVRELLASLQADELSLENPNYLTNTNTPEEWAKAMGETP